MQDLIGSILGLCSPVVLSLKLGTKAGVLCEERRTEILGAPRIRLSIVEVFEATDVKLGVPPHSYELSAQ